MLGIRARLLLKFLAQFKIAESGTWGGFVSSNGYANFCRDWAEVSNLPLPPGWSGGKIKRRSLWQRTKLELAVRATERRSVVATQGWMYGNRIPE